MKKLKVLHIVSQLSTGGIETWLLNVWRKIDRDCIEFHFLTSSINKGIYDDEVISLGGVIYYFPITKNPLVLYSRLEKIVKEAGIDIIHSHVYTFGSIYSIIGRLLKTPVIVHSHTTRPPIGFLKIVYFRVASSLINLFATKKLACTSEAGRALFRNAAFNIIWYGVDSSRFHPKLDVQVPAEFNIPHDVKVIGHVGRFLDVKNQEFILNVASQMPNGFLFVLIGAGPDKDKIANMAFKRKLSNVRILEPMTDVNVLFSRLFDLLILPSKFEGLGIVALEAQSAGIPVIVSENVPEDANVIEDLFYKLPLSSIDLWVNEIKRIKKPSEEIRIRYNEMFSKSQFSLSNSVKSLLSIYRSLAK